MTSQFDSDDEREAAEATIALSHKIKSQSIKKSKKNQSRLPRTAGLRTLSELTTEMTKAGLDPSRIQERAEMLAKVQGAARKRKREADMDVDMDMGDDAAEGGEDEWMDVDDGNDATPSKRAKSNTGAIVPANRKAPRTDRRLAGLRDDGVRYSTPYI
jgi:nucleolar GTP-binding protein